jgi:hypothetical protein
LLPLEASVPMKNYALLPLEASVPMKNYALPVPQNAAQPVIARYEAIQCTRMDCFTAFAMTDIRTDRQAGRADAGCRRFSVLCERSEAIYASTLACFVLCDGSDRHFSVC